MSLASLAKLGLQYTRTGLNYAGKASKVLLHETFGDGYTVISKARKSVGGGYTIFQNSKAKTLTGWQTLKADMKAVANKPGIFAKTKAVFKSSVSTASAGKKLNALQKLAAGTKGIYQAAKNSVKAAYKSGAIAQMKKVFANGGKITKATKIWGGIKGLAKPLCKMPMLVAIGTLLFEGPKVYDAFKNGGFGAGIKETGKVCAGLAVGGALGALGTVIGGPIGGMLGYMIGEQVTRNLLGDSESAPAEAQGEDELAQAQNNGIMPEEENTQALREQLKQEEAQATEQSEQSDKTEQSDATSEQTAQDSSELPATLQPSDTSVQAQQQLASNPFTQGYTPYSNPFGFDAGTNIFQRFPMGYTFQYQGNGMGMMV